MGGLEACELFHKASAPRLAGGGCDSNIFAHDKTLNFHTVNLILCSYSVNRSVASLDLDFTDTALGKIIFDKIKQA